MNKKRFNIPLNIILFGLLFSSSLPSVVISSVLFESIDPIQRFNLYIGTLFLREFFIFLLGIKLIVRFLNKIFRSDIRYRFFIFFGPLIPIIILILTSFNTTLIYTGIRFYILFCLPLFILEENNIKNFRFNLKVNDLIFIFYLFLNILSFAIGFKLYEGGFFGYTFLGARYPFIFDNPTVAALQFGIFLLYLNFRFTIAKNTFDKSKFLMISIGVFYLSLYTGGRAGIIISSLSLLVTILLYFFPKKRFIFNTPKSIKTKLFIMSILFTLSVGFLVLSSNKTFSGRLQTQTNISQEGLITGVYGSRLNIISQIKNERKFKDLLIGKPGLGTNTACNAVTSGIDAKECRKTDSLPATSLLSFGLIGVIFFIATFFAILNNSYSPLVPITFIIYSLSQIPPELIYIWTQMVIIVLLSRQHSKFIALQGI